MARAYLLDPLARVGAVADPSPGSRASQVKLAACGAIRLRLLGPGGLPQAGHDVNLSLLVERERLPTDEPVEDAQPVEWFDSVNYPARPRSDTNGLVELRGLIPGARYSLSAGTGAAKLSIGRFTIEPGATLNLPDVILDEPGDDEMTTRVVTLAFAAAFAAAAPAGDSARQTLTFQEGVNGYSGTVDLEIWAVSPNTCLNGNPTPAATRTTTAARARC